MLKYLNVTYYSNTTLITPETIAKFASTFPPTLFQECLNKKYELRIFYLDGVCYSSAIFSQNDPQTRIDFRNYNRETPNRVCPYQLPKKIEKRIRKLMNHYSMRSGSIDMVVEKTKGFVFLEVNPVGQFKQVSHPCNYRLEKRIAQSLMQ